ncbi:MAG: hypothetical protein H0U35_04785 [Sporichthyaceae bacterium]|nr:hypothetical protein [Sporichthyaceae bacterium]
MTRPPRFMLLTLFITTVMASCTGGSPADVGEVPGHADLRAEIVQLRRDVVLERVQVALRNNGPEEVVVERLLLRAPGFDSAGPVPKDSPVPPGQVVNLPVAHGDVRCDAAGAPVTRGDALVIVWVRSAAAPEQSRTRLTARDPQGYLRRIATLACRQRRLAGEVDLRFGSAWRPERTPDGVVLHGSVEARLLIDEPRDVTQVGGTVIYGLLPDAPADGVPDPLAALTPQRRTASVPVKVVASRCDGHSIGEVKQPYAFLVWMGEAGSEGTAVQLEVEPASIRALQKVCRL